ncbi:MAG: L,D-transpeptidase family protein [Phycisphaerae bacterium]|nr:L,D-transpeptidase family protein [Phycisphaerae bacterium]
MSRSSRKRSRSPFVLFAVAACILLIGVYLKTRPDTQSTANAGAGGTGPATPAAETSKPATLTDAIADKPTAPLGQPQIIEPGQRPTKEVPQATLTNAPSAPSSLPWLEEDAAVQANAAQAARYAQEGRTALAAGDLITARSNFSRALLAGLPPAEEAVICAEAFRLAEETILSNRTITGDPLVDVHVIARGETLETIAKSYYLTAGLLARINNIGNPNLIRQGQRIKVIHGPFHAVVSKSAFHIDVYLKDTLVKRFPVGLGTDDSTPTGEWVCKNKLVNPKYHPPRGGATIEADDPENPLGERWIGIEGVAGEATYQSGYGIHGTIDPESIGRAVSMGCIRLLNEDVEYLYDLLVDAYSRVVVIN